MSLNGVVKRYNITGDGSFRIGNGCSLQIGVHDVEHGIGLDLSVHIAAVIQNDKRHHIVHIGNILRGDALADSGVIIDVVIGEKRAVAVAEDVGAGVQKMPDSPFLSE